MNPETADKFDKGEMPLSWYEIPATEAELVSLAKAGSHLISADELEDGFVLFGVTTSGRIVVQCGLEFLDDGVTPNPNCRVAAFDTAERAVREFRTAGGKSLWPLLKGRRFVLNDLPMVRPDEP